MGGGAKTVIPPRAAAKISMRLGPRQGPEKILAAYQKLVEQLAPAGVSLEVRVLSSGEPILINPSNPFIAAAAKALTQTFGKPTVLVRGGGSIPIVSRFQDALNAPVVLMG